MTKKILSILLVLAFMTFFAACDKTDNTNSSSTSNASSAVSTESKSESKAASSSASSSAASSAAAGKVYKGDGFSFTIPEGFELADDTDGSVTFADANSNMINVEVQPNKDGKKTLTQKDVEEQLLAEAETGEYDASLAADILDTIKIENFKNIKVDGKEAVTFNCVINILGLEVPTYMAEIINGDEFIQFTLITSGDTKVLDKLLESVKIG